MIVPVNNALSKSKKQGKIRVGLRTFFFVVAIFCAEMFFFEIRLKDDFFRTRSDVVWFVLFVLSLFVWTLLMRGRPLITDDSYIGEDYVLRSSATNGTSTDIDKLNAKD